MKIWIAVLVGCMALGARAADKAPGKTEAAALRVLKKFDAGPEQLTPQLRERIDFYLAKIDKLDREQLERRREQVWPAMKRELAVQGLPEELGALAFVESRFDPAVRGGNDCAGLWQFIPETARKFGLRVDAQVDERIDLEKSTRAAGQYLSALLAEFGSESVLLAVASYNLGEAAMRDTLIKLAKEPGGYQKSKRNFAYLYQQKLLPEETAEYVPQFLAAAIAFAPAEK